MSIVDELAQKISHFTDAKSNEHLIGGKKYILKLILLWEILFCILFHFIIFFVILIK